MDSADMMSLKIGKRLCGYICRQILNRAIIATSTERRHSISRLATPPFPSANYWNPGQFLRITLIPNSFANGTVASRGNQWLLKLVNNRTDFEKTTCCRHRGSMQITWKSTYFQSLGLLASLEIIRYYKKDVIR
jgi:hypothetical protein